VERVIADSLETLVAFCGWKITTMLSDVVVERVVGGLADSLETMLSF